MDISRTLHHVGVGGGYLRIVSFRVDNPTMYKNDSCKSSDTFTSSMGRPAAGVTQCTLAQNGQVGRACRGKGEGAGPSYSPT